MKNPAETEIREIAALLGEICAAYKLVVETIFVRLTSNSAGGPNRSRTYTADLAVAARNAVTAASISSSGAQPSPESAFTTLLEQYTSGKIYRQLLDVKPYLNAEYDKFIEILRPASSAAELSIRMAAEGISS